MAFIEWVDMAVVVEKKPAKRKKRSGKRLKPNNQAESETGHRKKRSPLRSRRTAEASAPAEEPQPKKRRWFGRKSDDDKS